jgi:peptide deformylase
MADERERKPVDREPGAPEDEVREGEPEALHPAKPEALGQVKPEAVGEGEGDAAGEDEPPPLDPEVEARRAAAMSFIRKLGDPVLKSSATPVDRFDDSLRRQVSRMAGIMNDALGVGLAAPQLGISQRLLVYRVGPDAPVIALANPEIEWSSGDELEPGEEGCLSIPGVTVDVERPIHVRVRAQDEEGGPRVVEASGLEARVIQHEMDHLDGVLILERTSREERKRALRELREAERAREAA